MARIYASKKGKSGSTRPVRAGQPAWVSYTAEELKKLIVKMSKEGLMPSEIGRKLRDEYGIPSVKETVGKSVTKVLESAQIKAEVPEDLFNLLSRAVRLRKHLKVNKTDLSNKRQLSNTEMKIWRLSKYYKSTGRLPKNWAYAPERAALIVSGR